MNDNTPRPVETQSPRWHPLAALDRRVAGALVEKAKTTPDAYPMSVNSLRSACNQKNNRYPLMEVEIEDIEESLARLRAAGAVGEVQGGGRVARFRHYLYEWLGVDKVELAVMTELLLRGAQSEGDLRGRAARMEPIADVAALRPVLLSLKSKGLVISLSPEGRGHVVTHALYEPRELEKVRAEVASELGAASAAPTARPASPAAPPAAHAAHTHVTHTAEHSGAAARTEHVARADSSDTAAAHETIDELRRELATVRAEVAALRKDVDDLWSNFR